MGFLRKLFGGDKDRAKAAQEPSDVPRVPPTPDEWSDSPTRPESPAAQPPTMADLTPSPRRFYMEYVGGASAKFYAVSLEEEAGGTWRVRFNFGRIGFPRAWDTRVEGATWVKASTTYMALIDEKLGKGYEVARWPATLKLPDGGMLDPDESTADSPGPDQTLFRASRRGSLPPPSGGSLAGIQLPQGNLSTPEPEGGSRGDSPVIWVSVSPLTGVGHTWARLAAAFPETGIWPVVIDSSHGYSGFDDYLMDMPRGRHTEVATILRRNWGSSLEGLDEDEAPENVVPFGRQFPGLADRTPGSRPSSIDPIVASLKGHLGLVAVNRPADVLDAVGWMGAVNYDFDPLDMSTVLRSWEVRFDAYLVGLGTDTITLAVGRPPRDLRSAMAIAAEHYAFCSDIVDQGIGTIRAYAPMLVNESVWPFWWD